MNFNNFFLVASLFIAILPYKYVLKKLKISDDSVFENKKIWLFKGIIYWGSFFAINFIFIKIFNL
jgi:hypothetical protein